MLSSAPAQPAAITPAIDAPQGFSGSATSSTQIQLSWVRVTAATGYRLYEMVNGAPVLINTYSGAANSAVLTGLTPGTSYQFNLVAFNSTSTAATPWITVNTPAVVGTPGNFNGTAISNTQVGLTWSPASGAVGYRLYQMQNGQPVQIATYGGSSTSATVSGLTAGTTYQFNLVAFNGNGFAATPWISVTTTGGVTAPGNFAGTPLSPTQIGLSWTASANATGYRLYQMVNGQPVQIATYGSTATTAVVSNLTAGTTYSFNLQAFNGANFAATQWITVSTTGGLPAPGNFTGIPLSNTQVFLTWTPSTGASGYRLFEMVNGQPVQIASYAGGAASATVAGLVPGTTYQFNLQAFNANTFSATPWISVTTAGGVSAPGNFTAAAVGPSTVQLNWTVASNASGYKLYEMINGQPTQIATYTASTISANVNNLTPGQTYQFNLVAFNSTSSAGTLWVSVTMPGGLPAPGNFSGLPVSDTQVSLSWTTSAGAAGYRLYQMISGQPVQIATYGATATSANVSGLSAATTYQFNLVAFNGNTFTATPWINVTTAAALPAPSNFTGTAISGTQIGLTWTGSTGATGYRLFQMVNGQPVQIATYDASATSATVSNLNAGTTYQFNLQAFNSTSFSATPWISVTTVGGVPAPTNFAGTALSDTQIGLTWSASAGATGYNLYQMQNGQSVQIATYGASATSATVTGLTPSTTYQFNLVAFNATSSAATPWISVGTAGSLTPPGNFAGIGVSNTEIDLSWTAAANAAGYKLYEVQNQAPVLIATYGSGVTSAQITGLTAATSYQFQLVAYSGTQTAPSNWINVQTTGGLAPPTDFRGSSLGAGQVLLKWTPSAGAAFYRLYEMISGQPVQIASLTSTDTSYLVRGLQSGTTYQFKLEAVAASGTAATGWLSVTA